MKSFYKMKKKAAFVGVLTLAFFASVSFSGRTSSHKSNSVLKFLNQIRASSIQAAHASDAGATQLGNLFRMMTFVIIGFPDHATYVDLTGGDAGPENGMIGLINDIIGDEGAGQILKQKYASCADLPASGTENTTITEEGSTMDLVITFGTPTSTIPSRFTGAGATYEKKLSFALDDVTIFTYEFDCSVSRGLAVFSLPDEGSTTVFRKMKIVYQVIDNAVKADFGMYYNAASPERFSLRLDGSQTGEYTMYMARAAKDTTFDGFRATAKGNATTGKMTGYLHMISGQSTLGNLEAATGANNSATTGSYGMSDPTNMDLLFCFDYTAGTAELGACSGLALVAPDPTAAYPSTGTFTIENLASASFSSSF